MSMRRWSGVGALVACALGLRWVLGFLGLGGPGQDAYAILEWSSTIARSEGDLLALRSLLADPVAFRSLRSVLPTQELVHIQTSGMTAGEDGACSAGNDGVVPGRWLQLAFRYPHIASSRAYVELYGVCTPDGAPPTVSLREQGFSTSLERPGSGGAEVVAKTPEELQALQLTLEDFAVRSALVETLRERSLGFLRMRTTGQSDGRIYLGFEAGEGPPSQGQAAEIVFEVELDPVLETVKVSRGP